MYIYIYTHTHTYIPTYIHIYTVNVGERANWVQEVNGVKYSAGDIAGAPPLIIVFSTPPLINVFSTDVAVNSAGDIADRQLHDFLLKNPPKSGLSILSRNLGGVEGRGVDSLPGFPPPTCPTVQVSGVEEEVWTEDLANYLDGVEEESQKSQKSKNLKSPKKKNSKLPGWR
jgi:hypothetical protein